MDATSAIPTRDIAPIVPQEGTFSFMLVSLAFAFLIYITAKNELALYLKFFAFMPTAGATPATTTTTPATTTTTPGTAAPNGGTSAGQGGIGMQ